MPCMGAWSGMGHLRATTDGCYGLLVTVGSTLGVNILGPTVNHGTYVCVHGYQASMGYPYDAVGGQLAYLMCCTQFCSPILWFTYTKRVPCTLYTYLIPYTLYSLSVGKIWLCFHNYSVK